MSDKLQLLSGPDDENLPVAPGLGAMPALVLSAGEHGTYRFLEFFAAHLRNPNTRVAYFRDVCAFFQWCERRKIESIKKLGVTCLSGVKCASQSVHPRWEDTP
jgi:hypothetical protein